MAYKTSIEGAIERAEAILAARIAKKKKEDAPDFESYLRRMYVLDAVQRLYLSYRDKLPLTKSGKPGAWFSNVLLRRLPATQYDTAETMDVLFQEFVDKFSGSQKSKVERMIAKIQKIPVRNVNEVKKNWAKRTAAITQMITSSIAKKPVKEMLGTKHYRLLMPYVQSKYTNLDCALLLAKAKQLIPITDIPPLHLAKFSLKSLKKYDEKFLTKVKRNGGLSETDLKFVAEETEPQKGPKRVARKGDITPKTAPQYFTREKPYELLWKPIPDDALKLVIEKPEKNPKTGKWSYYAKFIDPRSGQPVTTYLQKHREENEASKFDTVRKFEKSGYDKVMKNNKKFLSSSDPDEQTLAVIVELIHSGSFRIGNKKSEKDNVFGISNLQVKHVKQSGSTLTFTYIGKKQKKDNKDVKCSANVLKIFKRLIKGKGPDDYIFTNDKGSKIQEGAVNSFLRKKLGAPKGISIHKFRHIATTRAFRELISDNLPRGWAKMPKEERVKWTHEQFEEIRKKIRHETIKTTLDSYIDPKEVTDFKKNNDLEDISFTAKNPLAALQRQQRKEERERKKAAKKPKTPKAKSTKTKTRKVKKVLKDEKSVEKIKKKIEKKPKRLVVKVKRPNKVEDVEFEPDEFEDLDLELDDLLKKYKSSAMVHTLINTAALRVQASEEARRIGSCFPTKVSVPKNVISHMKTKRIAIAVTALTKIEWKKGMRAVIRDKKELFIGTVTSIIAGFVHIKLDSGSKIKFKKNSKFLVGIGIKRQRKTAIPAGDLNKWLAKEDPTKSKTPKVPKSKKVKVAKKTEVPVKRDLQKTIDRLTKKLEKEKSGVRRSSIKKKIKEAKIKQSKRAEKELARIEREKEKQRKIAEKVAKKLRKKAEREKAAEEKKQRQEEKRRKALERAKAKEAREKEKYNSEQERTKRKIQKQLRRAQKKEKERIKKRKERELIVIRKREGERIVKEIADEKKREKIRKEIADPKQKTPKVITPKKQLEKVKKVPPKIPKKLQEKGARGMKGIIKSIKDGLGTKLSGVPKIFNDPDNLAFMSPANTKKRNTVGIRFEALDEEEYPLTLRLSAYLDKDNAIEGDFDNEKQRWVVNDTDYGVAEIAKKNVGNWVTDARFCFALQKLIEEAKQNSGYVSDREELIGKLKDTLYNFNPGMTSDGKSLIVDMPISSRTPTKITPYGTKRLSVPDMRKLNTINQLTDWAKENKLGLGKEIRKLLGRQWTDSDERNWQNRARVRIEDDRINRAQESGKRLKYSLKRKLSKLEKIAEKNLIKKYTQDSGKLSEAGVIVALKNLITRAIAERNATVKWQEIMNDKETKRKTNIGKHNLLQTLTEDGWKQVGWDTSRTGYRTDNRTVFMRKGGSEIALYEQGTLARQTIITPLDKVQSEFLHGFYVNPTYSQVRAVINEYTGD